MRSFERVYELTQQTPMIHFQYGEHGATLRATEVKPKLDKYIFERYKADNRGDDVPESWKLGESNALNYKMHITSSNKEVLNVGPKTAYDIFYGNMGSNDNKKAVFSKDIELKIICTIKEMLVYINEVIKPFFISSNFGTMQRKGFGSFTIGEPSDEEVAKELLRNYDAKCCYAFPANETAIKRPSENDVTFKRIKTVYGIMKSGINIETKKGIKKYRRSLLFLYMYEEHEISNEKAFLKQNGMAPVNVGTHKNEEKEYLYSIRKHKPKYVPKYVRALLGVSGKLEFIKDTYYRGDKAIVRIKNNDIQRLKSPVFFKVVGNTVYYVGEKINDEVYNKKFSFESDYNNMTTGIAVPDKNDFDLDGFLRYCQKELNKEECYLEYGFTALTNFRDCRNIWISRYEGGQWHE